MSEEPEEAQQVALQNSSKRPTILSKTMKAIGMVNPIFKKKNKKNITGMDTVDSVSRFDIDAGGNEYKDEDNKDVDREEPEKEFQERYHFQGADEEFTIHRQPSHPTDIVQDMRIDAQQRRRTESQRHGLEGTSEESADSVMDSALDQGSRGSRSPSSESSPITIMLNAEDTNGAIPFMNTVDSPPRPSSRSSKARASSWRKQHHVSKSHRSRQQDPPGTLPHLMEASPGHVVTDHSKAEKKGRRSPRSVEETLWKNQEDYEKNSKSSTSTQLESFSMARVEKLIFEVRGIANIESDRGPRSEMIRVGSNKTCSESDDGSTSSMDFPAIPSEMKTTRRDVSPAAQKADDGANRFLERKGYQAKSNPLEGSRIVDCARSQSSNHSEKSRRNHRDKKDPPGIVLGAEDGDDETSKYKYTEEKTRSKGKHERILAPLCPRRESCTQASFAQSETGDSDFSTISVVTVSSTERSLTGLRPNEFGILKHDIDLPSQRSHPSRSRRSNCRRAYDSREHRLQDRKDNRGKYMHPLQLNRRKEASDSKVVPITSQESDTPETSLGTIIGKNVEYTESLASIVRSRVEYT